MNQYLKSIQDLLQQNSQLSGQEKEAVLKAIADADKQWSITDFKLDRTEKVKKTTAILLEETIAELEQKRKAVEAQNRELEIESSLERVRARAMAMQKSDELKELISTVSAELGKLDFVLSRSFIIIFDIQTMGSTWWMSHPETPSESFGLFVKYHEHPPYLAHIEAWKERKLKWQYILEGEIKETWDQFLFVETELSQLPDLVIAEMRARKKIYLSSSFNNFGYLTLATSEPLSEEQFDIMHRFAKVIDLTYTRFNDLKQAEAQARESQIQLALERVRARTMAMQKSDELAEAASLLFTQIADLGTSSWSSGFIIFQPDELSINSWMSKPDGSMGVPFNIPVTEDPFFIKIYEAYKRGEEFFVMESSGKELEETYKYMFSLPGAAKALGAIEDLGFQMPTFQITHCVFFPTGFLMFITYEPCQEMWEIFKRFGKIFEQTYTRFLDLQKAEAQAREAKIEAALEKVRSRTMAMQRSAELAEVATVLFQQVKALGVHQWTCGFGIFEIDDKEFTWYQGSEDGNILPPCKIPLTEHPVFIQFNESRKRGDELYIYEKTGELQTDHYRYMCSLPVLGKLMQDRLDAGLQFPTFQVDHVASFSHGNLVFITYEHFPEMHDVFKRFAKVFDQTYTRFLDLQKSEAQSREAKIQLAMERVRARTMAMQHSDELADASFILDSQVRALGIKTRGCAFNIYGENESTEWFSSEAGTMPTYKTPRENVFLRYYEEGQKGRLLYIESFEGDACAAHYDYLCTLPVTGEALKKFKESGGSFPAQQIDHVTYFKYGYLLFITLEPVPDAHDIFKRFAAVFEQTYTRFLDLQKAEAQAREAQIEASLERVRASAMAMHRSDELSNVLAVLFEQFDVLKIQPVDVHLDLFDLEKNTFSYRATGKEGKRVIAEQIVDLDSRPEWQALLEKWKKGKPNTVDFSFYPKEVIRELMAFFPDIWAAMPEDAIMSPEDFPDGIFDALGFCKFGYIGFHHHRKATEEEQRILIRFANEFERLYQRFLDLQKAEAQAREAIKQASVDRVRAEIASMRTTHDLERIQPLIWTELKILGIPFIRCGVFIMDEQKQEVQTMLSTPEGKGIATLHVPFEFDLSIITNGVDNWRRKKIYKEHWDAAAFTQTWIKLSSLRANSLDAPPVEHPPESLYLHLLPFLQGMLYVGNDTPLNDDELNLVQNLADAFATAYARYEDFNKLEAAKKQVDSTLDELQTTQKQLIQSEKMASLGELTAGIAHEIQNPLNFVNNFSEVNKELLGEMKDEIEKGNMEEVKAIANDIIGNEEKISHHGKRADAIVKGMLQHSRSTSTVKEPADINALADEYLRLSYHGLRAKDKSFNATMKTDFDGSIGTINIIPQDIGRVLLNLYNNSFYAVSEKKKQQAKNYEPTVSIKTRKLDGEIELSVKDNGNGIPQKLLDKIFQPFFTTKPTGQGTGLGLSLAYDIVKAHGGELKVDTKEGVGSEFIIRLRTN